MSRNLLKAAFAAVLLLASAQAKAAEDVVLKVNGVVCPACAYGIQKKVSKLSFVDTGRLHDGVEIDVEKHLAKVAIREGQKANYAELFAAIRSGGFDPVGAYVGDRFVEAKQLLAKE